MRILSLPILLALCLAGLAQPPAKPTASAALEKAYKAQHEARDFRAAILAFEAAKADDPTLKVAAYRGIAECQEALGELEAAKASLEALLQSAPTDEAAQAAKKRLESAIRGMDPKALVAAMLADVRQNRGDFTETESWQRLRTMGGDALEAIATALSVRLDPRGREQWISEPALRSDSQVLAQAMMFIDRRPDQALPQAWAQLEEFLVNNPITPKDGQQPAALTGSQEGPQVEIWNGVFEYGMGQPVRGYDRITAWGDDGLLGLLERLPNRIDDEQSRTWPIVAIQKRGRLGGLYEALPSDTPSLRTRYAKAVLGYCDQSDLRRLQHSLSVLDRRFSALMADHLISDPRREVAIIGAAHLSGRYIGQQRNSGDWREDLSENAIARIQELALQAMTEAEGQIADLGYRIFCMPGPAWPASMRPTLVAEIERSLLQYDGTLPMDRIGLILGVESGNPQGLLLEDLLRLLRAATANAAPTVHPQLDTAIAGLFRAAWQANFAAGGDGKAVFAALQQPLSESAHNKIIDHLHNEVMGRASGRGEPQPMTPMRKQRALEFMVYSMGSESPKIKAQAYGLTYNCWNYLSKDLQSHLKEPLVQYGLLDCLSDIERVPDLAMDFLHRCSGPDDLPKLWTLLNGLPRDPKNLSDRLLVLIIKNSSYDELPRIEAHLQERGKSFATWSWLSSAIDANPSFYAAIRPVVHQLSHGVRDRLINSLIDLTRNSNPESTRKRVSQLDPTKLEALRHLLLTKPAQQFDGWELPHVAQVLPPKDLEQLLVDGYEAFNASSKAAALELIGKMLLFRAEPMVRAAVSSKDPLLVEPALTAFELLQRARRVQELEAQEQSAGTSGAESGEKAATQVRVTAAMRERIQKLLTSESAVRQAAALQLIGALPREEALDILLRVIEVGDENLVRMATAVLKDLAAR